MIHRIGFGSKIQIRGSDSDFKFGFESRFGSKKFISESGRSDSDLNGFNLIRSVWNTTRSLSLTSDHSLFSQISDHNLSKKSTSSMKDFLEKLDKEFGDGKFTCYLSVFEEQEIRVSHLTKLSDSEYILIGITIIGCKQTLHDEAKKYE